MTESTTQPTEVRPVVERRTDSPFGYWCPTCQYAGHGYHTEGMAKRDAGRHACGKPKANERYEPREVNR